jgi:hypothetical protein
VGAHRARPDDTPDSENGRVTFELPSGEEREIFHVLGESE